MNSSSSAFVPSFSSFLPRSVFARALIGALASAGLLLGQASHAASLELEVQGVNADQGQILVSVFTQAKDWLSKPVMVVKAVAAERRDGKLLIALHELPEGPLALNVTHDLNGNGRLDMNAMGMPTEPYGFSNNALGSFGPPSFEAAQFSVKPAPALQRISVRLN